MAVETKPMNVASAEDRVCPDCGSPAGTQPFCARCGRNLSMVERLPTRMEWERNGRSSPASAASSRPVSAEEATSVEEDPLIEAVAGALTSTREWWVPLHDVGADMDNPAVADRLKLSVHDHVLDAIQLAISKPLNVEVDDLAASVPLADGRSIRQQFAASVQRTRGQARIDRVGPVDLVDANGEVIRAVAAGVDRGAEARSNRRFLIWAYVLAVLIPVVGVAIALYTAVSERRAAIRRHAIAIAGVALLAFGGYFLAISAITSSTQDRNVASDLRSLFDSHGIQYDDVGPCAHQTGNQYICTVTRNGQPTTVAVTDDGTTIYEQGISPGG